MRKHGRMIPVVVLGFAAAAAAGTDTFYGLPHTTMGDASLSMDPQGRLAIGNIGSSGQDGVEIHLGQARGVALELDIGPAGALATGQCTYVYHPYDWRNGCIYVCESGGGSAALGIEGTGAQPSCVHVELHHQGLLVDSTEFEGSLPPTLVSGDLGSDPGTGEALSLTYKKIEWDYVYEVRCGAQELSITGSPTGPVLADTVRISLDGLPPGEYHLAVARVHASDMPGGTLVVSGEALLIDSTVSDPDNAPGCSVRALGSAAMTGLTGTDLCAGCLECCENLGIFSPAGVSIDNLGSSGQDGVEFRSSSVLDEFAVVSSWLDPDDDDDNIRLEADGTFAGSPDHPLGSCTLRLVAATGAYELSADYSAIGSSDVTIEVRENGVLQGSVVVPGGSGTVLGNLDPSPAGLRWSKCGKLGGGTPCFVACTDLPFTFIDNGGIALVGDDLRVLASSTTGPVSGLSAFRVLSSGGPPFTAAVSSLSGGSPPVLAHGLPSSALGQSSLSIGDVDGDGRPDLVVANIGSSGQDGVSFDPGTAQGMELRLGDEIDLTQPGSSLHVSGSVLTVQGALSVRSASMTNTSPSSCSLTCDDGNPGSTLHVELLDAGGQRLLLFQIPSGDALSVETFVGIKPIRMELARASGLNGLPPGEPVIGTLIVLDDGSGGGVTVSHPVHGSTADVHAVHVVSSSSAGSRLSSVALRAAGPPSFSVTRCAVIEFDNAHITNGDSSMQGAMCSSGAGGAMEPSLTWHVVDYGGGGGGGGGTIGVSGALGIDCRDDDSDDDGLSDVERRAGGGFVLDGSASQDDGAISSFSWEQVSGPFAFSTQPGDIVASIELPLDPGGSSRTLHVGPLHWMAPEAIECRVYSSGGSLLTVSGALTIGDVAVVSSSRLPTEYEFELEASAWSGGAAGSEPTIDGTVHRLVWPEDVTITLSGQAAVIGRELHVHASPGAGAVVEPVEISSFALELESSSDVSFTITDEHVLGLEPPCPADVNGDQLVNVDDLVAVIIGWGPCPPAPGACSADIEPPGGNGVVNVDDLVRVIVGWGACP